MSRHGPLCLLLLLSTVSARAPAQGQPLSRIGAGLTIGLTPNLAEGFSTDQLCRDRSASGVSARATLALTGTIQLEAMGEIFRGPPVDCIDGLVPPPPPTGPFTWSVDYYEARITDPPNVLSLRLGRAWPQSAALTLRPYIGIARLAGKGITTPQAGLTVLGGGGQLRLLLEAEGWWYSVPEKHLEEEYFDGRLVRRSLTEHGVRTFTTIFRVGLTSSVGRS